MARHIVETWDCTYELRQFLLVSLLDVLEGSVEVLLAKSR